MKPFIVVADGMDKKIFQQLLSNTDFEVYPESKISAEKLLELAPKINALVIRSATTITAELLEKTPELKYVIRAGEGTDNIDKVACEKKGVKVSNTPGANNNSAAEHAIALMMTLLRKTAWAAQTMQNGGWDKSKFVGVELAEKKIGIIGLGRIGQIVAKRLAGFDVKVLYFDPHLKESPFSYATPAISMQQVFSECDIVTLHTPLTAKTKNMINADLINLMPKHACLINASRGGVVDEAALETALKEKKIRGAAFDVFAVEPLPKDSSLRSLDNLIMTPHLGASTEEAQINVGKMAVDQLISYFFNRELLNEVKA